MKYVSTLIFLILAIIAIAQSPLPDVYIKLENGSEFRGSLLEYEDGKSITILIGESRLSFPLNVVKKMKIDGIPGAKFNSFKDNVFYHKISTSILGNENQPGYSFHYSLLYQFNNRWAAGGGVGLDNYLSDSGFNLFPIFLEGRLNILDNSSTPFLFMKTGYALAKTMESRGQFNAAGGFLFNPGVGVRLGSGGLMVDIFGGVRLQRAEYKYAFSDQFITDTYLFKRLEFGLGFMF